MSKTIKIFILLLLLAGAAVPSLKKAYLLQCGGLPTPAITCQQVAPDRIFCPTSGNEYGCGEMDQ
ncbi:MAG: hypothetical protein R3C61_03800 [Bacteroidia bacterium]